MGFLTRLSSSFASAYLRVAHSLFWRSTERWSWGCGSFGMRVGFASRCLCAARCTASLYWIFSVRLVSEIVGFVGSGWSATWGVGFVHSGWCVVVSWPNYRSRRWFHAVLALFMPSVLPLVAIAESGSSLPTLRLGISRAHGLSSPMCSASCQGWGRASTRLL